MVACNRGDDKLVVGDNTPVEAIMAAGKKESLAGKGTKAGDYYLEVERLYPYTPQAEQALILASQAYHDDGALVESRIAAQRYIQFFPGSPNIALAKYLVALSYYDGIVDVTRDQARTFEALKALQLVIDDHPGTQYAKLAEPKFNISLNQLAGKEMDIGRYYLARGHYVSAIARFKAVVTEYPENRHQPEAYHRMIETYLSMGLRNEAEAVYAQFTTFGTSSDWYKRSNQLLKTGTQPNAGGSFARQLLTGTWQ